MTKYGRKGMLDKAWEEWNAGQSMGGRECCTKYGRTVMLDKVWEEGNAGQSIGRRESREKAREEEGIRPSMGRRRSGGGGWKNHRGKRVSGNAPEVEGQGKAQEKGFWTKHGKNEVLAKHMGGRGCRAKHMRKGVLDIVREDKCFRQSKGEREYWAKQGKLSFYLYVLHI